MKPNCLTRLIRTARQCIPLAAALALSFGASAATLVEFPFNEGEGAIVTDVASGLQGTLVGLPDPATDRPVIEDLAPSGDTGDMSVRIQGNGYLVGTDTNNVLAFAPDQPFTIEAWVFLNPDPDPDFLNVNEGILTYGGVYKLGFRSATLTFTLFGEVDLTDPSLLVFANGWHHVAAAFEPGVGVTLYLDGFPVFVESTETVPPYVNNLLYVGAERGGNNILGNLDRVRVHSGLLTAEELDTDPANPKPVLENTIVAYDFEDVQLPVENSADAEIPLISSIDFVEVWSTDSPEGEPGDFSLDFNGTVRVSAEDSVPVIPDTVTNYTLEAYVKLPEGEPADSRMIILEYRGVPGFSFSIDSGDVLHTTTFRIQDIRSAAQVPRDGEWHHVAVVHESGVEMRFYVDGTLSDTIAYTEGPGDQSSPLLTIGNASSGNNPFFGSIDRVRISDAALSPEEFDFEIPEGAPIFSGSPEDVVVQAGGTAEFTAEFTADAPRTLQWLFRPFNSDVIIPIEGATSETLTIEDVQFSDQGYYSLNVSNAAGDATSTEAQLTIDPIATEPGTLEQVWYIAPGDRPYITPGDPDDPQRNNTERGMAYNPVTDHVLVVARETSPILRGIYILEAETGDEVGQLDTTGIAGGTFVLNKIAVAEDGAIYAINFGTFNGTSTITTVYRWENESAIPTIAFSGNPNEGGSNQQYGKNFAVRGSGADTQILLDTRTQVVAILTTTNGTDFTSTVLDSEAPDDAFSVGTAFGEGNTFWGKDLNAPLYHMAFDLEAGAATITNVYPEVRARLAGIAVDTGANLLAGINVTAEGPDSVELYDLSNPATARLLDTAEIPADNPNTVIGGNAAFGENNMLFALDTNNGLIAYRITRLVIEEPELSISQEEGQVVISWPASAGSFVLEASPAIGPDAEWTTVAHETVGDENRYVTTAEEATQFFRLRSN